jgi:serine/threonine protein kinase
MPIEQRGFGMQKKFRQYNLTKKLAKKYSHSTYLASPSNEPERQVILTVFTSSRLALPHECENLLQKAQCIKELQHPHLVSIVDMGIEQGQPFVVRDYLPKGSLRNRLELLSPQSLELSEALSLVLQVGQALAAAHEHGIFHGNIKPENILFDIHDQVVLADFALVSDMGVIIRDHIAEEYAFCYMAPEQFVGTCDAQSDQYGLGCLAYELITGQEPFGAKNFSLASRKNSSFASIKEYHSNALPAPVFEDALDLPPSLKVAVLKALAKDPAKRFFDFSLFLEVIQAVVPPSPVFAFARSAQIHENRTPSRSESLSTSQLLVSESTMTTFLSDEAVDQELINYPFEEEQEEISLARASVSSVREWSPSVLGRITSSLANGIDGFGSWVVRRKRSLVLALLASMVIVLVAQMFWPFKMFTSDTNLHTMTSPNNENTHLTAMPTVTPAPTSVLATTSALTTTPIPIPRAVASPKKPTTPVGTATPTPSSPFRIGGGGGGYPGGGGGGYPGRGMW